MLPQGRGSYVCTSSETLLARRLTADKEIRLDRVLTDHVSSQIMACLTSESLRLARACACACVCGARGGRLRAKCCRSFSICISNPHISGLVILSFAFFVDSFFRRPFTLCYMSFCFFVDFFFVLGSTSHVVFRSSRSRCVIGRVFGPPGFWGLLTRVCMRMRLIWLSLFLVCFSQGLGQRTGMTVTPRTPRLGNENMFGATITTRRAKRKV